MYCDRVLNKESNKTNIHKHGILLEAHSKDGLSHRTYLQKIQF